MPDDIPDILFGPVFENLPFNYMEGVALLRKQMRSSGSFIKLVVEILALKEDEEQACQATEAAFA